MDKTTTRRTDQQVVDAATPPRQFFRASSRIYCLNGEWYFQSRENDHGPFTRREAAEAALSRHIEDMQDIAGIGCYQEDGAVEFDFPASAAGG